MKQEVPSNDKISRLTLWNHNTLVSFFHRPTSQACCSVWNVPCVYLYRFQTNSRRKDSGQTSVCWHWSATGLLQIGNTHGKKHASTLTYTHLHVDKCLTRTCIGIESQKRSLIRLWQVLNKSTPTRSVLAAGKACEKFMHTYRLLVAHLEAADRKANKVKHDKSCYKASISLKLEPRDVKAKLGLERPQKQQKLIT